MRKLLLSYFFIAFLGLLTTAAYGQRIYYRDLPQGSPLIKVELFHEDNSGLGSQHAGVIIHNLTANKLRVELEYFCEMYCGEKLPARIGFGDGVILKPHERFGGEGFWEKQNEAFDAGNRASSNCKAVKIAEGKYSKIRKMGYRLITVENLTQKEQQKALAEEKAAAERKAAADKLAAEKKAAAEKLAAEKKAAAEKAAAAAKKAEEDRIAANKKREEEQNATASSKKPITTSSSGSASSPSGSSKAGTNSGTANKPQPYNNLPDLFKTNDGKYYRKDSNGQPYEISYNQYQAERAERAAAQQPATPKKSKAELDAEAMAKLEQVSNKFQNDMKERQERDARRKELDLVNTQDRDALRNVKENLDELTDLRGVYETVEELNQAYDAQYTSINNSMSELTEARNRELNSRVNASFSDSDATTKAVGEGLKALGTLANEMNEEKQRQAYQEELRRQREAQERAIKARKRAMIMGIRNNLISKFTEGQIPLSSQKVKADRLYYFVYAYDKATIDSERPVMYVSNVFEIGRYGDGTWPFKSSISNEIQKLTPFEETMHGYYKSQEEAEEMQQAFKDLLEKGEVSINPVTYKGRKSTVTASNGSTDFWGNENKKSTQTAELDFWGNPVNKTAPVQTPQAEEPETTIDYSPQENSIAEPVKTQEEPANKQTTELDFWGNPVK